MSAESKSERLKSWALEAGFDRAGVAALEAPKRARALRDWLARGDQAGMEYMERRPEVRCDPRRLLPGARSVVCVALQYHPLEDEPEPTGDLWPRVARYARGRDYHQIMEDRLDRLTVRVRKGFPAAQCRYYVDTGPVLERELAARAGLGAFGKNTNLLHPEAGSWFLLGELFLTLELAPDRPLNDLCGTCTACLEACPTGALPEPYRLDSRRCISYWTIEHRGVIPPETRAMLGDWVFGCDICQEVCPANVAPLGAAHPELRLPAGRASLDLTMLLTLHRKLYEELFRGSPLKRAKLEGLKRNAAIAMGNSGRPRYIQTLIRALRDDSTTVRQHAAWALGRIGGTTAQRALLSVLEGEETAAVRAELRAALGDLAGSVEGAHEDRAEGSG